MKRLWKGYLPLARALWEYAVLYVALANLGVTAAVNQTLARSLYTSVTAFLAILPMAVWGGVAVESFAIPMLVGIVIAASSSIFIAAPILLFLGDWRARRRARTAAVSPATNKGGEELAPGSSP